MITAASGVLTPFKEATLERGRAAFKNEGLITVAKSSYHPLIRRWFQSAIRTSTPTGSTP